jgi:signal transduction histidine kinase/CheY-like chemotaxis protein/HPt (histidine-containing phosphotransfer) domain-containing protein
MVFLLVMSVLMVVTTYQNNVKQHKHIDLLSRQKESVSNLYLNFTELKTKALNAVLTPSPQNSFRIETSKASFYKDLNYLKQTLTSHQSELNLISIRVDTLFAKLMNIVDYQNQVWATKAAMDEELHQVELVASQSQLSSNLRLVNKLRDSQIQFLADPSNVNYLLWQTALYKVRLASSFWNNGTGHKLSDYSHKQALIWQNNQKLDKLKTEYQYATASLDSVLTPFSLSIKKSHPENTIDISFFRDKEQRMQLLFILLAFLIINASLFYIIWNFSNPIKHLLRLAKDVEKGNYDSRFESPLHSELSKLGFAYNQMLDTIKRDREIISRNQAELEEKVKLRTQELEKAKELAETASMAKSDFLAKMSHEIRTPLNGIIGTAEVLAKSGINPYQADFINIIHSSGTSLLHIINDILNYSSIENGNMELRKHNFSLRKLIDSTLTQFKLELARKHLYLNLDIDPALPDLYLGDTVKIKQILVNIIVNAIKFTQLGGITITVQTQAVSHPYREVLFKVADTGVGIPPDKLSTIFESFTQVDNTATREFGGTGLGTTISQKLVELMDGKIWAESPNPDNVSNFGGPGSVFSFHLKLEQTEDYFFELYNDTQINIRDITLIVLTQSKEMLLELSDIFSYNWIKPIHCHDVKEVYEVVRPVLNDSKDIIVLTDYYIYRQENMDDILKLIRNSNISFMAMIPSAISSTDSTLQSYGINHILTLPFRQSVFLDKITEILNERYTQIGNKQITAISKRIKEKPLRMLLAEDNHINQKVALVIFETIGFAIDIANNGKEAIDKALSNNYDLIFMDIQMPVLDGIEATKFLREEGITTPIIAMTANAICGDRESYIAQGMSDYISKPITYNSITDMIKKWIFAEINDCKQLRSNRTNTGEEIMQQPILNEKEAINRVYDKDLLKELLTDFIAMKELDWAVFEKCLSDSNLTDMDRISHSIKGVAGNLALTGIYTSATDLNNSVKLGEIELIKRHFEELKLEVERFRAFLPEYLNS